MQPQVEASKEEKTTQQQTAPATTNSVDTGSKLVEEQAPSIKTDENQANWRAFRERRESERKDKEAAQRMAQEERTRAEALKAALEAATATQPRRNDNYEAREESEDERIERRVAEAMQKHEAHYERKREEREQREAPQRILQTYPDFNEVVTTENCDYLDYKYPELTAPFKYMPEGYEKWSAMYKAVKKFVPNVDSRKDMTRADRNLQKPGSISSTGATTGTSAMPSARLDEQRKADNWARMQKTLKGLS